MQLALSRKRVRVLYMGGIHFSENLFSPERARTILEYFLDFQLAADVRVDIIDHHPGAASNWSTAIQLGELIQQDYDDFDGFVIVHSVDNVLHIANALQFMLPALGKPVIFTGTAVHNEVTPIPDLTQPVDTTYTGVGLQTNLLTAMQVASMDCSGVMLSYGPYIVRAVRAIEHMNSAMKYFTTIDPEPVLDVQFGIHVQPKAPKRFNKPLVLTTTIDDDISVMRDQPGSRLPAHLGKVLLVHGLSESLVQPNFVWPTHLPVIVISVAETTEPLPNNVIHLRHATVSAAFAKAMLVLPTAGTPDEFKNQFLKLWCKEFN